MKKIENLKAKTAEKLIRNLLDKDIVLQTDERTSYSKFEDFIEVHVNGISGTKEGKFNLK